ncbi:hypothetical protein DAPPUDRAFT_301448 [Daphnia pulex]|uniref:Peptidase S1 domain-containing protein n=1 Tax=Daphnia pulex TaxID=6669 RepID=E9HIE1_DAPPU|nr:hypothetical protein DAPPUDRAFT_301448 [Daphnia pulex]|eukprot:EFX68510.1 hypothetical protein DAPPUDRAFT_301448 [Daphnia pulex]
MKLTTTFPIFLCCLLHNALAGENVINDQERILGGTKAQEGEFPFVVSITTNGEHLCAGFIYNQRFIVTTVTCVQKTIVSHLQHRAVRERRYQVVSIIPHENYDVNLGLNNLAVIETSSSMAFTAGHVDFICYNEDNTTFPEATVMGWGATQEGGLPSIDLLKASVTISTECVVYGSEEYQPNYMICAGSDTASPCHYDEGSPLVQDNIVVGVASRNTGCKELFLPTLYTRLSSYYAWLNRNAGQQPPACSAA